MTGKALNWGGSLIRPEATGYGTVYFAEEMLNVKGDSIKGKTVAISGSGNVAQYATEKVNHLGGKVVTLSDSSGTIYDPNGIDEEKLKFIFELKNVKRGRIKDYTAKYDAEYWEGQRPWKAKCGVAMPCATQNEVNKAEAASDSVWKGGWRPFVGWVCGAAFAYHFVIQPLAIFVIAAYGMEVPSLPVFEMGQLMTVLMGMLGLGGLRSFEKTKGVAK